MADRSGACKVFQKPGVFLDYLRVSYLFMKKSAPYR